MTQQDLERFDQLPGSFEIAPHATEELAIDTPVVKTLALTPPPCYDVSVLRDCLCERWQHLTRLLRAPRTRAWVRKLVWLAAGVIAVILLMPRLGELNQAREALRSVRWEWLVVGALVVPSTYIWAALALRGAVDHPLSLRRTTLVQLAGSFMNKVAPKGLGGIGVNQRYLEQVGVERPVAVAGIALNMAAGAVVHVLSLLIVSALLGRGSVDLTSYLANWPTVVGLLSALMLLALALYLASPATWRKLTAPVVAGGKSLLSVLRSPSRALVLFAGVAGVTAVNVSMLSVTLHAVGVPTSLLKVAAVYMGGEAVASANPTPGNLGAIEAALVVGLTTQGVQAGPALASVLTYRLLAFWLPILPGFLALRYLQQREVL
jgi:uncharacterized membrane protein YbhN (UPF0104 family)